MRTAVRVTGVTQLFVTVAVMMAVVAVWYAADLQRDAHAGDRGRDLEISRRFFGHSKFKHKTHEMHKYRHLKANLHDVHNHTDASGDQHDRRIDVVLSTDQTLYGHEHQNAGYHPDQQHRRQGANHLRSIVAETHLLRRRPAGHPDREQADHEAGEIGQQVSGVCRDGQRVGEQATDRLADHEQQAEQRGDDKLLAGASIDARIRRVRRVTVVRVVVRLGQRQRMGMRRTTGRFVHGGLGGVVDRGERRVLVAQVKVAAIVRGGRGRTELRLLLLVDELAHFGVHGVHENLQLLLERLLIALRRSGRLIGGRRIL